MGTCVTRARAGGSASGGLKISQTTRDLLRARAKRGSYLAIPVIVERRFWSHRGDAQHEVPRRVEHRCAEGVDAGNRVADGARQAVPPCLNDGVIHLGPRELHGPTGPSALAGDIFNDE